MKKEWKERKLRKLSRSQKEKKKKNERRKKRKGPKNYIASVLSILEELFLVVSYGHLKVTNVSGWIPNVFQPNQKRHLHNNIDNHAVFNAVSEVSTVIC